LRAAPIPKRSVGADANIHPGVLHAHLEFAMGIQAHGGAAFVHLPPTPQDARVAKPTITFSVEGWSTPTINGLEYGEEEAFEIFPGQPTVLSSLLPGVRKLWWNAWAAPCADQLCLWLELQAPLPSIHPIDAVLAIDISPSTRGVHLKRIVVVAQRITSLLPTASRIMPVAFASRAIELTPSFQKDLPPELWHRLDELDLGRSTRWLPLCRLLSSLSTAQSHLFWIGDGGLTPTHGDHECARELMSKNVKVHLISVAPPSTPFLELARVLHTTPLVLPREAMDMSSTDSRELDHWLKEVLSPMPPQPIHLRWSRRERIDLWLYPGEFTNLFLPISPSDIPRINRTPLRVRPASPSLSALLLAIHQPARRLIAAPSFRSLPPCPPSLPTTFAIPSVPHTCSSISPIPSTIHHTQPPPPQSVQRALHRQILPCARDCFRSDRRGRSSHQARVEVEFVWHQGEIESIETKGNATPSLQDCVAQCFERLELPQVEHPLRVRWALYNLPEEREPPLPIDEELGASIEALFPTSSDSSYPILLAR
ncbi:MAG: hypothetical protein NZM37_08415, partial [Sandaracinaceae bacterium]|nr:hypothetical protein [Sandaracinaceae bacterium]